MPRILAIALAFLMGCPYCWCCTLKQTAQGAVVHECCAANAECALGAKQSPTKKSHRDSCDCDLSKTKRQAHQTAVSLPPPLCQMVSDFAQELLVVSAQDADLWSPLDTRAPPGQCLLYVSHGVLRP